MPFELDKGHDQPIFGPESTPDTAERFRVAGGRTKALAMPLHIRVMRSRTSRRGRRGRPA